MSSSQQSAPHLSSTDQQPSSTDQQPSSTDQQPSSTDQQPSSNYWQLSSTEGYSADTCQNCGEKGTPKGEVVDGVTMKRKYYCGKKGCCFEWLVYPKS